jgi:hypothetical protein
MKTNQISQLDASKMKEALALQAGKIAQLEQQLNWFKRQIFGQKSEKQLFDSPHQTPLFGCADAAPKAAPPAAWLMMRSSSNAPSRPALAVREGGALGWRGWRTRTRPARREALPYTPPARAGRWSAASQAQSGDLTPSAWLDLVQIHEVHL